MRQMRVLCSRANAMRIGLLRAVRPTGPSPPGRRAPRADRAPDVGTRSGSATHGVIGRPADVNPQKNSSSFSLEQRSLGRDRPDG
jgi:hypothetical protein